MIDASREYRLDNMQFVLHPHDSSSHPAEAYQCLPMSGFKGRAKKFKMDAKFAHMMLYAEDTLFDYITLKEQEGYLFVMSRNNAFALCWN